MTKYEKILGKQTPCNQCYFALKSQVDQVFATQVADLLKLDRL